MVFSWPCFFTVSLNATYIVSVFQQHVYSIHLCVHVILILTSHYYVKERHNIVFFRSHLSVLHLLLVFQ